MSQSKTVQRHRTIPMTKRESVSTNGSRLSLISNNSNASNQKSVPASTEKKRSKKIKRNESYKIATERLSIYEDDAEGGRDEGREIALRNSVFNDEGRRKYNTLPLRIENNNNEIRTCNKPKADKPSQFVLRNASVKSGTYPSPDTDDDQRSVEPERKKKSAFKRFKERLLLSFKRDESQRQWRSEKRTNSKSHSSPQDKKHSRRKSNNSDKFENKEIRYQPNSTSYQNGRANGQKGTLRTDQHGVQNQPEASPVKIRRELNIFKSFRDSFKKSPPEHRRQGVKTSPRGNNNDDHKGVHSNNATRYGSEVSTGHRPPTGIHRNGREQGSQNHSAVRYEEKGNQSNHVVKTGHGDREHEYHKNKREIERSKDDCVDELEDTFEEGVNLTTDIFGAIIDPSGYPTSPKQRAWGRQGPFYERQSSTHRGPDRSKLRLEGLRKNRPKSFDNTPNTPYVASYSNYQSRTVEPRRERTTVADVHQNWGYPNLSPTVETDGPDYADGVVQTPDDEVSELSDAFIDADDHKRKVNSVAQCLKIIADKIVEEKRRTVTEDEIVIALREIADEIDREKFKGINLPGGVPKEFIPVLKNIITAKTYASFSHVIQQALRETVGWEHVAWYTFLTKSAIQVAGIGQETGRRLRSRAMKYFNSSIRPWVESRPYGWESIHEDTDIESELD